jgi:hypothetical protein
VLGSGFLLPDGREFNKMETNEVEQQAPAKRIVPRGSRTKPWLVVVLVVLCVAVSWVGVIDDKTEEYVDGAFIQAVGAYAGARALNAGISLLQSGEIGGGIVVEMSIHPFESLDPINDMVEDYATVMKYAIGSLVIQELLVEILSNNIFKWLITVSAVLLIASLLLFNGLYASSLLKSFFFVALVRFLFVVTILASGTVDNAFVNEKTEEEMKNVDIAASKVAQFEGDNEEINRQIQELEIKRVELTNQIEGQQVKVDVANTVLENAKNTVEDIIRKMSPTERLERYVNPSKVYLDAKQNQEETSTYLEEQKKMQKDLKSQLETVRESLAAQNEKLYEEKGLIEKTSETFSTLNDLSYGRIKEEVTVAIESMLKLIALFVFKTLLMPVAFLLLNLRAFKLIWGIDPRGFMSERYLTHKD